MLGPSSFDFTRENPTGYYHLNLAEAGDRAICMVLQELRSLQIPRLRQIHKYYQNRTGGPRDELERVWRNVKFDGKVVPFDPAWRVPQAGTLELDFVQVASPASRSLMLTLASELLCIRHFSQRSRFRYPVLT